MMEAGDAYASLLGNVIEGGGDFLIRASESHTEVASGTLGTRDPEVKISIRIKYSTAAFGNEGMAMLKLAAQRLDLCAGARGEQYQRNAVPIQLRQGFLSLGKGTGTRIEQGAFKGCEDQMARSEQGRKKCNADEPAAIWAFSECATAGQDTLISCPSWSIRAFGRADRPALLIAR
jgi:hypothetical protein